MADALTTALSSVLAIHSSGATKIKEERFHPAEVGAYLGEGGKLVTKNENIRLHFSVPERTWNTICEQSVSSSKQSVSSSIRSETFIEQFFDTEDFALLRSNCWLVRRFRFPDLDQWKLKMCREKSDTEIKWFEYDATNLSGNPMLKQISRNLFTIQTTRLYIMEQPSDKDSLWIDISNWMDYNRQGFYVVGTLRKTSEGILDLKLLQTIFGKDDVYPVVSKAVACLHHLFPQESDGLLYLSSEKPLIERYGILEQNPLPSIHHMTTLEDLKGLIQKGIDESDEEVDDEYGSSNE